MSLLTPSIAAKTSTLSGWSNASARSAAHQSLLYPEGTSFLLFSRNSPKPDKISPESHIVITLSEQDLHSSTVDIRRYEPSLSNTVGPSKSMHGVAAQALPGRSVFICVPTEMNPPWASIDTGFTPAAARPVARLLPYLRRNAPGSPGPPNTGRPAITSCMNLSFFGITLPWNFFQSPLSCFFLFHSSNPLDVNLEINSQPGICKRSVCF